MNENKYYKPVEITQEKIETAMETVYKYHDIVRRVKSGETYESVAKDHGITRQRVHQIIKNLYLNNQKNALESATKSCIM